MSRRNKVAQGRWFLWAQCPHVRTTNEAGTAAGAEHKVVSIGVAVGAEREAASIGGH
jgi:hypothetical protein